MKPPILAGLVVAGLAGGGLACSQRKSDIAAPASPARFTAPGDSDRKFDSSLAILIAGYRAGGDAGAEAAAKSHFVAWSGPMLSVNIVASSSDGGAAAVQRTRDAGAEVVRVEDGVIYARAGLGALEKIAASEAVRSIVLSPRANPDR